MPTFAKADVASALRAGSHVVLTADRELRTTTADVLLPRIGRQQATEALQKAGLDFYRADRMAGLGRRSMPALVRRLSQDPRFARPEWTRPPHAQLLAALVLVVSWTTAERDRRFIERLANGKWEAIRPLLVELERSVDPVVRHLAAHWTFTAPEDAFMQLQSTLSGELLARWADSAYELLTAADGVESPGFVAIRISRSSDHNDRISADLRRGVARGAAIIASLGHERDLENGAPPSAYATGLVRRILLDANRDPSGAQWRRLADLLPLLAEASPETFLDALDEDLTASHPIVGSMFEDSTTDNGLETFTSSSSHTGLLWALETLCWNGRYLIDGVRALARLAVLDPGGKLSNRPIMSLQTILVGWVRHTSADWKTRWDAFDAVTAVSAELGWELLVGLWPRNHSVALPPATPTVRDWRPDNQSVSVPEWVSFVHELVDRAIAQTGHQATRLVALADGLSTVTTTDQDKIIRHLSQLPTDALSAEDRLTLWTALDRTIARHRRFASAQWAMPAARLSELQSIADAIQPEDAPGQFAYLFSWHPDLPDVELRDSFEEYQAELERLRAKAIAALTRDASDLAGVESVLSRADAPHHVGWALADHSDIKMPCLMNWFEADDRAHREAAAAWVSRKLMTGGPAWLEAALGDAQLTGAARSAIIRNVPANSASWQALAAAGPELLDEYWRSAPINVVECQDSAEAVDQLIKHDRPWAAIEVLSFAQHQQERGSGLQALPDELITEALDAALRSQELDDRDPSMAGYNLGVVLDHLEKEGVSASVLARYEFGFFRLLEHHREPRALNAALSQDPALFTQLASRVYRGKNESRRELSADESELASHSWSVLEEWHGYPGRQDDGSLNAKQLRQWVTGARLQFAESDRDDIGDELIGKALARTPPDPDETWPGAAVRDLLETIGSRDLENGIVIGKIGLQGVTTRGLLDGGKQEWDLVAKYRQSSDVLKARWPRTARVLRDLAEYFEGRARQEDLEADLRSDR